MTTPEFVQTYVYECAACGKKTYADSPYSEDAPEGVYLALRRVTAAQSHYQTPELYTCSKECAIALVQYGIHNHAEYVEPIGRKPEQ